MKLISIHEEKGDPVKDILKKLRSNAATAPTADEIAREVNIVRAKRYDK
jgi:hypothetical protein